MNHNHDNELEVLIDQELKQLPPIAAPRGLVARVMKIVEARASLPWYRRPWTDWPLALRAVSLVMLLALFGMVVFGTWRGAQSGAFSPVRDTMAEWLSSAGTALETFKVLLGAMVLTVKHLGTGFMVGCIMIAVFSYFACIGLGTVVVRMAIAKR